MTEKIDNLLLNIEEAEKRLAETKEHLVEAITQEVKDKNVPWEKFIFSENREIKEIYRTSLGRCEIAILFRHWGNLAYSANSWEIFIFSAGRVVFTDRYSANYSDGPGNPPEEKIGNEKIQELAVYVEEKLKRTDR